MSGKAGQTRIKRINLSVFDHLEPHHDRHCHQLMILSIPNPHHKSLECCVRKATGRFTSSSVPLWQTGECPTGRRMESRVAEMIWLHSHHHCLDYSTRTFLFRVYCPNKRAICVNTERSDTPTICMHAALINNWARQPRVLHTHNKTTHPLLAPGTQKSASAHF
jgi:hypothetical protein